MGVVWVCLSEPVSENMAGVGQPDAQVDIRWVIELVPIEASIYLVEVLLTSPEHVRDIPRITRREVGIEPSDLVKLVPSHGFYEASKVVIIHCTVW